MIITSTISTVASLSLFALLVAAALAPVESLSWWAGWTDEEAGLSPPVHGPLRETPDKRFVIYLSGISTMTGHYLADQEARFLERLASRHPDTEIISDIFPYAPSGAPLFAGPRLLDRLWRSLMAMRLKGRGAVSALANLRNFFQVLVSADQRYGPIFNLGAATVMIEALERHGYRAGSGSAVTIIGFSGGAQIGVGASPYLAARLGAPVDVISIGGVIASGPGVEAARVIHQFYGARDRIERLGVLFFPERWRVFPASIWNRARHSGKIRSRRLGPLMHSGPKGYFGLRQRDPGRRYVDETLDAVSKALNSSSVHQ